jgi:predicted DCC family thiol-disulfide oxidoreductase YuxK
LVQINEIKNPVVLFDGVCNLCSYIVQFIIKRDKKKQYLFASLQGLFGQQVLKQFHQPGNQLNSFILLKDGKIFTQSTSALKVAKELSGLWKILYVFIIIPPFIRNAVYQFIASNRYKWFGKKNECWLPTSEISLRFID